MINAARKAGVTLLELLMILAVIGILAGISAIGLRSNNSRLFANDARQLLQQAKFESVKRVEGVSVVWSVTPGAPSWPAGTSTRTAKRTSSAGS